jgi:hypothetical protein
MKAKLLRFNGAVERDPAIDAWIREHVSGLGSNPKVRLADQPGATQRTTRGSIALGLVVPTSDEEPGLDS